MRKRIVRTSVLAMVLGCSFAPGVGLPQQRPTPKAEGAKPFEWPNGKRAAVSLSFDDARTSQVDNGLTLFQQHHVKVTFFLQAENIGKRLEGWKKAVADGHEMGNHTITHPCTGNYPFSRQNALEDYSLEMMAAQLDGTSTQIDRLLGVKPRTFAYPCGQKFVGRGLDVRSYVPLVAERFVVGRGYLDEAANDPAFCDLSQAMGTAFDDLTFEQMKTLVTSAVSSGRWIIFVGHDIGERGFQVTDATALAALCDYLNDPANSIWVATVAEVGDYLRRHRPYRA